MNRPKIKIQPDAVDKLTEAIGIIAMLILIILPLYYYNSLPETIPSHYGVTGKADGFANKSLIWMLPIIGLIMYAGLAILNKYPHIFNYPGEITKENVERQYRIATKMIRVLNTSTACIFAYITYSTIQTSLGSTSGLGNYFVLSIIIIMIGTVGFFLFKAIKEG